MLLVSDTRGGNQARPFERGKLAMHRPEPAAGEPDDLVREEALVRSPEQDAEHPLLRLGEQRVRKRSTRSLRSHIGNDRSQNGIEQTSGKAAFRVERRPRAADDTE